MPVLVADRRGDGAGVDLVAAELVLAVVAVVVREAAVPSSPRWWSRWWRWSAWSRCRRARGGGAVVADLVVAELVVVAALHEERLAVHDTRR